MSAFDAVWSGPIGRLGLVIADDFVTRVDRLEPGPEKPVQHPLAIVVPCHRLVAANGIGGYGRDPEGGRAVEYKRWLLDREREMAGSSR